MNLPLIIAGMAVGGYFLFNKYMNVNTFAKAFDYRFTVKNFRFHTLTEIRFGLEITILNPSSLSITIANPLLQVFYDGSQITRSNYNIPAVSIKPNSQSVLPVFEFSIDIISNWFAIQKMLGVLLKGATLSVASAKDAVTRNQAAFLKLLNVQFTGYLNNTPFTKSFNLG
jgi:hypothetical protein